MFPTGTGSGKTEAFLLPILDRLFREQAAGTLVQPGVRALLLYPMNVLANDQGRSGCANSCTTFPKSRSGATRARPKKPSATCWRTSPLSIPG